MNKPSFIINGSWAIISMGIVVLCFYNNPNYIELSQTTFEKIRFIIGFIAALATWHFLFRTIKAIS